MTNKERSSNAKQALMNSGITPGTPGTPGTNIVDLITDLLHLAWEEKLLPGSMTNVALRQFEAEALYPMTFQGWLDAVEARETLQGYHDWVNSQRESEV